VTAIRAAKGAANAESALGEVETISRDAADAVVGDPADIRLVDPTLVDEILDEPADRVVGERGDDGRFQPEATPEPAGHVVLAAPLPNFEASRRRNPRVARVEAKHHFAERDEIETAARLALDRERHGLPAVHRAVELPVDRKVGAIVRVLLRERLVDVDSEPRLVARIECALREGVGVWKDFVPPMPHRMPLCTR
jgi:hypothetical protein